MKKYFSFIIKTTVFLISNPSFAKLLLLILWALVQSEFEIRTAALAVAVAVAVAVVEIAASTHLLEYLLNSVSRVCCS